MKTILVIKESNFKKEKKLLKKMGFTVRWEKNFQDGKKSLEEGQFDLIIIGIIFLNQKDKEINGSYSGKRGGLKFIKNNIQLLHEHIKDDKVIIYYWNKNWGKEETLPSEIAKSFKIKFIDKDDGLMTFGSQIQRTLEIN